jgi:ribosomal protein S27E
MKKKCKKCGGKIIFNSKQFRNECKECGRKYVFKIDELKSKNYEL